MVDVVIIGGGPAGITAGVVLQRRGYQTCVIDRQKFPREKLCAGVLTTKSLKFIQHIYQGLDIDELNINFINNIMLFYKNKLVGKYTVQNRYGVVDRENFDYALLNYYQSMGGRLLYEQKQYQICYSINTVKLSSGEEIKYQFLLGADGMNSQVREYVQRKWKSSILCFEKFIPNDLGEDTIKIYFGQMLGGYCWRIPGKERIGIGLGEFYVRKWKRDVSRYEEFYRQQGVEDLAGIRGAFVSSGYYVKRPVKNNVLLAGDAAGMIDAMSGEGIFFAMESGRQAALAIIDCLDRNKPLTEYFKRIKRIHKRMSEQNKFNKLLYVPGLQGLCMKYMKNNSCYAQAVLEDAMSSYRSGYTKEFIKSIF